MLTARSAVSSTSVSESCVLAPAEDPPSAPGREKARWSPWGRPRRAQSYLPSTRDALGLQRRLRRGPRLPCWADLLLRTCILQKESPCARWLGQASPPEISHGPRFCP